MAFPSDLTRTKDWGTEILTDSDLEGQFDNIIDWIDDFADEVGGHKHDGTTNEGPKIQLAGANIGVQGGPLSVSLGGTGLATLTDGAVLLGSGTGTVTPLPLTTDGAIVIGDGTTDPTTYSAFSSSTGTLKMTAGGTGQATIAQGEILYASAANTLSKLGVGTDGQFLQTQGAGANVQWANQGLTLLTATTVTNTTNSGNITITKDKKYLVKFDLVNQSGANTTAVSLRFNSNTGPSTYQYVRNQATTTATPTQTVFGSINDSKIPLCTDLNQSGKITGTIELDTVETASKFVFVMSRVYYDDDSDNVFVKSELMGYFTNATVTDYEIFTSENVTGKIYTYEYTLS